MAESNVLNRCEQCAEREGVVEDVISVVIGYCQDCEEHLCESCFGQHKIPKPCRNHKVVKINDLEYEAVKSDIGQITNTSKTPDVIDEKCPKHKNSTMEFYCKNHYTASCVYCYVDDHIACKVIKLNTISRDILYDEQRGAFYEELQEGINTTERMVNEIDENSKKVDESHSRCKNSMENFRKQLDDRLDALQQNTDVSSLHQHVFNLPETRRHCLDVKDIFLDKISEFDSYRENDQPCKMFMASQLFKQEMATIQVKLDVAKVAMAIKTFDFVPDRQLQSSLYQDVDRFGALEEHVDGSDDASGGTNNIHVTKMTTRYEVTEVTLKLEFESYFKSY